MLAARAKGDKSRQVQTRARRRQVQTNLMSSTRRFCESCSACAKAASDGWISMGLRRVYMSSSSAHWIEAALSLSASAMACHASKKKRELLLLARGDEESCHIAAKARRAPDGSPSTQGVVIRTIRERNHVGGRQTWGPAARPQGRQSAGVCPHDIRAHRKAGPQQRTRVPSSLQRPSPTTLHPMPRLGGAAAQQRRAVPITNPAGLKAKRVSAELHRHKAAAGSDGVGNVLGLLGRRHRPLLAEERHRRPVNLPHHRRCSHRAEEETVTREFVPVLSFRAFPSLSRARALTLSSPALGVHTDPIPSALHNCAQLS